MDYAFYCPFCKHHNPKLIINIKSGQYNCWTCHPPTKGRTPVSLFKRMSVPQERINEMKGYFGQNVYKNTQETSAQVSLPQEFIPLMDNDKSLEYRHAITYCKKRGITELDILKYNIGYCKTGRFRNRIVVPSYDKAGQINYFIARSYEKEPYRKYDAPSCNKNDLIGLEYFVNWKIPVILCEGMFDAMAFKRNTIPLFGKTIPKALMMKLVESDVKTIYLALDKDAFKESISYAQKLIDLGKDVYLVELDGKDPSDLGFEHVTKLLHTAKPLTFGDLLLKKMSL